MSRKTSLTPSEGIAVPSGSHAMRRGGARREVSDRVLLRAPELAEPREGWALNLSRGGIRVIVEDGGVVLGQEYDVTVGDDTKERKARIVWMQEEPDGVICGMEFMFEDGTIPPAPPNSQRLPGIPVETDSESTFKAAPPEQKPEGK